MAKLSGDATYRAADSNYVIGGNICNAFAVGVVGADDDFFMIAARPRPESNYPLISGNFLDAEGRVLCKLERNVFVANPGNCAKIFGERIGYEIRDANGSLLFRVSTQPEILPDQKHECWMTTIEGNFYDKNKNLVVESGGAGAGDDGGGGGGGFIETSVGCLMGFDGEVFGRDEHSTAERTNLAGISLLNHAKLFEPIYGTRENETIDLEGKALMKGSLIQNCEVYVKNGKFALLGGEIVGNKLNLTEEAMRVAAIMGIMPTAPANDE
jgi:hypothetical protein